MLEQIYQLSRHFLSIYQRPFVRYFFKTHHLDNRFTILLGQRGVGKSTALVQYLLSSSNNSSSLILPAYVVQMFSCLCSTVA